MYFEKRDRLLKAQLSGSNLSEIRPLQRIPGDNYVQRGRYLELETRGSGPFGWITRGLDTETGDLVAIKELRFEARNKSEVSAEVSMGIRFTVCEYRALYVRFLTPRLQNERGLFPTLSAMCEHGRPEICCSLERFFLLMPIAISDFTGGFWGSTSIPQQAKLHFLKETLEGLKTLHAMGIMHRDIRPRHMLIMSIEPPRAALCDYGKAVEAKASKYTKIGPIYTLAPEVWTVAQHGPYTAKIDMWAYGYAIAEVLGYKPSEYAKITQNQLASILMALRAVYVSGTEGESLVDLVSKLLIWRPQDRWSAKQALKHKCWLPIALYDPRSDDTAQVSERKRALPEDAI